MPIPECRILNLKQRLLCVMLAIPPSLVIPASMTDLDTDGERNHKQDKPCKNDSDYLL